MLSSPVSNPRSARLPSSTITGVTNARHAQVCVTPVSAASGFVASESNKFLDRVILRYILVDFFRVFGYTHVMHSIRYCMIIGVLFCAAAGYLIISLRARCPMSLMMLLSAFFCYALFREGWREYHLLINGEIPAAATPERVDQITLLSGLFGAWLAGIAFHVEQHVKAIVQRRQKQVRDIVR